MALLGTIKKQPAEVLPFSIDYSDVLDGREHAGISTVVVSAPAGLTVSATSLSGNAVSAFVSSGTADTDYLVTVTSSLTVSGGTIVVEDEIRVKVRSIS